MRYGLSVLFILCCCWINSFSQEFNCRVQINTQQISGTDKSVYEDFKKKVESFMAGQQWSNLKLAPHEKIDCSLNFIFKSNQGTTYTCDFQIQSQRPVYGSTLNTTLLNTKEELTFDYQENQTLSYQDATGADGNLIATLAFWSYVMLGLDFDSFSLLGGTPFYQKAKDIASMAQGSFGDLWKGQEDRNHWGWITALSDENHPEMRVLSYEYHRLGLDVMYQDAEKGRAQITKSLDRLRAAKQARPRSPLLSNFLDSKAEELINIYSKAGVQEKQKIYDLLLEIYPAAGNRLQGIKNRQ